jgi:cell division septal protein FtsQ
MSEKRLLSRSELVRKRRRAQIQHQPRPPKKKGGEVKGARNLPPITMRGVVNEFTYERYKKAGKRHFDTSYRLPFGETRSFTDVRFRFRLGWRLLSFGISLLLCYGLYMLWSMPELRVSAAQVSGNQRIANEEINTMLGLSGKPSFLLAPRQIEKQMLRDYPELLSIQIAVGMPNIVDVNVQERQPVILWQQDGGYTWIDEGGIAFRPHGEVSGLIIVNAINAPPPLANPAGDLESTSAFIAPDTVKALQLLQTSVPQGTTIMFDQENGLSWLDPRGWQAIFGTGSENIAVKVRIYQAMVDWLTQRGTKPVLINVTYPNAPYYQMAQERAKE